MAINWTEIESEYVTGTMSYRELAADKGISFNSLKEQGRRNDWKRKRDEHRKDCTARASDKAAETVSDQMAELQKVLLEIALVLANRLNRQITEAEHLKPSEMLQYARVLVALNEFVPDQNPAAEADADSHYGIVILPARADIDPPPD